LQHSSVVSVGNHRYGGMIGKHLDQGVDPAGNHLTPLEHFPKAYGRSAG
jgi:hypothetical protein